MRGTKLRRGLSRNDKRIERRNGENVFIEAKGWMNFKEETVINHITSYREVK